MKLFFFEHKLKFLIYVAVFIHILYTLLYTITQSFNQQQLCSQGVKDVKVIAIVATNTVSYYVNSEHAQDINDY